MGSIHVWCRVTIVNSCGSEVVTWELTGPRAPDLATVDGLARLQLEAKRLGLVATVSEVAPAMAELLELAGLLEQRKST